MAVSGPPPVDPAAIFDLLLQTGIRRGSIQAWREAHARHMTLLAVLLGECVSLTWVDESGQHEEQVFEYVRVLLPGGTTADEFEAAFSKVFGAALNPVRGRFTLVENASRQASIGEAALVGLDGCSCVLIASGDAGEPHIDADAALALAASLRELPSDARPACLILVGSHVELPLANQDGPDHFDVLVDLQRSPEEAWRALEQRLDTLDDAELTNAAMLAFVTGRLDTSRALLRRVNAVGHLPSLVAAIRLAHALGEEGPRARLEHALLTHHPHHSAARELRVARWASEANWNEVATYLADSSELTPELQYQAALAAFALSEAPSMVTFLEEIATLAEPDLDRAWRDGIGALQARNEHLVAVRQVLESNADERTGASGRADAALALLRQLMLRPPVDAEPTEDLEQQGEHLASIVLDHVADHPGDRGLRTAAMASFTPEASGAFGVAYLTSKLLEDGVASLQLVDTAPPPAPQRIASEEEFFEFVRKWLDAISQDFGVIMAHHAVPLPKGLRLQPADAIALLARAAEILAKTADLTGELGESITELDVILSIGLSLLLEFDGAVGGVDDIGLFQLLGQSLAIGGHHQRARQTAEGLLAYNQVASPRQRRRAWRVFADILQRCGDVVDALFGAVCSTRIAVESLPTLDRYEELELRIRLFRVLGLYETALSVANDAALLRTRDPRMERDHSFDDTVASVRFMQLFAMSSTATNSQLQREFDLVAQHYTNSVRMAYAMGVGTLPPLVMLGQLIRFAGDSGLEVTAETRAVFADTLEEFPPRDTQRIRALTAPRSRFEDLLRALRALANVRYTSDLAIDLEHTRHMARRFLDQGDGASTHELLVAIEVLADLTSARQNSFDSELNTLAYLQAHYMGSAMLWHGAPPALLLGSPDANPPHPSITSLLEDPLAWSHRVAARFVGRTSLCALAVTQEQHVVHLLAREGSFLGPILESTRRFDFGRFRTWAELYPRGYGALDRSAPDALSFVEQTLDNIELAGDRDHDTCLVFLPTAELASLPANLLRFHDGHAGATGPTATIPSLGWLDSRRVPAIAGEGREAWILPSSVSESRLIPDALGLLQGELPAILKAHGFRLHIDAIPRRTQSPPALALVVAHGAVRANGSFAYIADERGQRFRVSEILTALDGADVLLALICNAGHLTHDRLGGRPLGLPRDALAANFRAVVASPWPLDAFSASEWLPLFLDAWSGGSPLARAVYEANLKLRATRPHPSDWLAMHVYGDYELTMPSPG